MECGINSYLISSRRFDSVLTAAMLANVRDGNQEINSCSILVSDERNDADRFWWESWAMFGIVKKQYRLWQIGWMWASKLPRLID